MASGRRRTKSELPEFADDREIWERQPNETDRSWEMFKIYRDMGPSRTQAHLSKVKKMNKNSVASFSARWGWRERAAAYDAHIDRIEKEAEIKARREAAKEMTERHLKISTHLQRLVQVELLRWLKRTGADAPNPDLSRRPTLSTSQLQGLLEYGVRLERLNRDEPESIVETRGDVRPADLEAKIERLLRARKK